MHIVWNILYAFLQTGFSIWFIPCIWIKCPFGYHFNLHYFLYSWQTIFIHTSIMQGIYWWLSIRLWSPMLMTGDTTAQSCTYSSVGFWPIKKYFTFMWVCLVRFYRSLQWTVFITAVDPCTFCPIKYADGFVDCFAVFFKVFYLFHVTYFLGPIFAQTSLLLALK